MNELVELLAECQEYIPEDSELYQRVQHALDDYLNGFTAQQLRGDSGTSMIEQAVHPLEAERAAFRKHHTR